MSLSSNSLLGEAEANDMANAGGLLVPGVAGRALSSIIAI